MALNPQDILNNPFLNKGTAFTKEERQAYGLQGTLPAKVQTLDEQAVQAYGQYSSKTTDLEKRIFLMNVFNTNRTLFYRLMEDHVVEFMPIVYDPTVADSIEQYNELFVSPQDAAFLSVDEPEDVEATLKNAPGGRDIRLIVVTDSEGILGMGDWGVNGVDIAIGKLMVYTAAAGINPSMVLPVVIDAGTNNEKLLHDPLYLGNRHERVRGERYYDLIDRFVQASGKLFPEALLHWEDFGRSNAATILEKYQDKITTFNDDIQGTGIVVLAGILGAMKISKEKLTDQRILIFGAGTAGVGITNQLLDEMKRQGLSEEEARKHFFLVDKQGLLFNDTEELTPGQKAFVHDRSEFENSNELTNLEAAVKAVQPTIMIGTSTQPGAFKETIIKEMAAHTERPVIFPLSNPTKLAEAKAEDLIKWTDGKALVATGIPAAPVDYKGVTYEIGQANNALMYPGLGFGIIASTATRVNGEMLSQASHALGGIVDTEQPGAAVLPPVAKLTEFSQTIAEVVGQSVLDQKLNREEISDIKKAVSEMKWEAKYTDLNL
ncbi:malolactic enzyme [Sporolactobacillus laevolacticus]|uniref:Malolactic enzyme n=1 Tax=Sporolactobacillus laevolacticus DSM 442 TaxID=1395513 RepID=V6IX26_9BACL|nr:malolactic enzyme [Sporolactobacillus laevolacticus]EST11908.1 Malolactic enzyme [Sporolactobacillus laevolacticus DSM 442]